ncbi:hypothetical protein N1851_005311 [Merluccius polli]|uniref:Tc1-like transposase DDE domain-containing protein n=1 Tax=Merluccius polli TaxID=89951 RepID=A0AA47N611_MERPO|nr:hypothetical protein N1851_005311 [Merluccius polli]
MHEAGQRVQPNLSRFTVASVIRTFRLEHRTERLNHGGGRGRLFTGEQETAIVNLVLANNKIRLREIQSHIIQNNTTFNNIQQGVLEMDAHAIPHEYIFIDEAGFNLAKTRRRGRNIIGHRAIIDVPGQRGGNITMCAAISNAHGVLHRHANLGPYNTAHMLTFLDRLHNILIPPERIDDADHQRNRYVVVWDNVSFHRAAPVQNWFADHPPFLVQYLPPYSPFLNPIEEFFSAWRWKVYDRQPHVRIPLMQGMEEACDEIAVGAIQGWIRHSRRFFPRCLARENIACDVDEALWPDPASSELMSLKLCVIASSGLENGRSSGGSLWESEGRVLFRLGALLRRAEVLGLLGGTVGGLGWCGGVKHLRGLWDPRGLVGLTGLSLAEVKGLVGRRAAPIQLSVPRDDGLFPCLVGALAPELLAAEPAVPETLLQVKY